MKLKRKLMPMVFAGLALPIVIAVPTLTVAMKTSETNSKAQSLLAFAKQITTDPAKVVASANIAFATDESGFVSLVEQWNKELSKNAHAYNETLVREWYRSNTKEALKLLSEVDQASRNRLLWGLLGTALGTFGKVVLKRFNWRQFKKISKNNGWLCS